MNLMIRVICLFFLLTFIGGYVSSTSSDVTSIYLEQADDTQEDNEGNLDDSSITPFINSYNFLTKNIMPSDLGSSHLCLKVFLFSSQSRSPPI